MPSQSFPEFEAELSRILESHLSAEDGTAPTRLSESIRYSLLAPGKRIRPRLLLASARLFDLNPQASLSAAAAIEMIHCYTLIHDDLPCMDNDDFRRGRPSNHRQFDEATALLAGDSLIAVAVDALLGAQTWIDPRRVISALKRLSWSMGPRGVIGGQAQESELHGKSDLKDLRAMHAGKTGALFKAALLIPADLAGIEPESAKGLALSGFADEIGSAFQVADDLEDAEKERDRPTSILFYQSRTVAVSTSRERLTAAQRDLIREYGPSAQTLSQIADEVLLQLQN